MTDSAATQVATQPPRHVAIIMDGNGRWAQARGQSVSAGHRAGVERIREVLDACREQGVQVLTVFAFSSENWSRPKAEVEALMSLFQRYLSSEAKRLAKEGVRLKVVGERARFSPKLQRAIIEAESLACEGDSTLVIAADYGGRWDIVQAAKRAATALAAGELALDDIDEDCLDGFSALAGLPAVDLLIRTGGEQRISNFLLWQAAYAELYFSPLYWPDFDRLALQAAIDSFAGRQRRFGGRQQDGTR